MKKIVMAAALCLAFASYAAQTNEAWLVQHAETGRYCSLTNGTDGGKAAVYATRLGRTPCGAPLYPAAELVALFGGDDVTFEFADQVDSKFWFWGISSPSGKGLPPRVRKSTFREIWRRESAGEAD